MFPGEGEGYLHSEEGAGKGRVGPGMEDFIALGCSDLEGSSADAAHTAWSNSRTSEGHSGMQ